MRACMRVRVCVLRGAEEMGAGAHNSLSFGLVQNAAGSSPARLLFPRRMPVTAGSTAIEAGTVPTKRFCCNALQPALGHIPHARADRDSAERGRAGPSPPRGIAEARAHSTTRSVSAPSAAGSVPLSLFSPAALRNADVSRRIESACAHARVSAVCPTHAVCRRTDPGT